jgi:hypothetical protein
MDGSNRVSTTVFSSSPAVLAAARAGAYLHTLRRPRRGARGDADPIASARVVTTEIIEIAATKTDPRLDFLKL